ncbi:unnamed protein product (macronuclear) [Paramecium tetraurelia]|uniref:Peptide deformylase n=1 Tax=Paramecium tetraurelia TaxID=5888 RepID=A0C0K9_PARTE|nr:uncharacterized protein GSPATT00006179001 [Paramecium tetraurelia]CAK64326.1 unnamed protein product [Paramecium tetraurelia]|eukprot:XP_001431724.1 hypothetical protein (macronuclear) [Paramecium tetraurelia strain d4-2]
MQKYLLNGFEVFKVLPISHEILRKKIFEHYNFTNKEEDTLSTMIDTLRLYNKLHSIEALALAAPQVGWEKRLFVCADLELQQRKKAKYIQKVDVYLNPEIIKKSNDLIVSKENCLSIPPNQIACVMRSNKITMKYYNLLGIEMVVEAEGLQACIYQHEIDHLDGINALEKATSIIDSQQR